jgi:quercetin dioxygenase-like cupin family protein
MNPPMTPRIRRTDALPETATRRAGIREQMLLGPAESPHQNAVLVTAETGARVELHRVPNSESFFVLAGRLEVSGPGFRETLGAGDFCHFAAGMEHAMTCLEGPARFLVTFAPGRALGSLTS